MAFFGFVLLLLVFAGWLFVQILSYVVFRLHGSIMLLLLLVIGKSKSNSKVKGIYYYVNESHYISNISNYINVISNSNNKSNSNNIYNGNGKCNVIAKVMVIIMVNKSNVTKSNGKSKCTCAYLICLLLIGAVPNSKLLALPSLSLSLGSNCVLSYYFCIQFHLFVLLFAGVAPNSKLFSYPNCVAGLPLFFPHGSVYSFT